MSIWIRHSYVAISHQREPECWQTFMLIIHKSLAYLWILIYNIDTFIIGDHTFYESYVPCITFCINYMIGVPEQGHEVVILGIKSSILTLQNDPPKWPPRDPPGAPIDHFLRGKCDKCPPRVRGVKTGVPKNGAFLGPFWGSPGGVKKPGFFGFFRVFSGFLAKNRVFGGFGRFWPKTGFLTVFWRFWDPSGTPPSRVLDPTWSRTWFRLVGTMTYLMMGSCHKRTIRR